jgi:hypothetical protein
VLPKVRNFIWKLVRNGLPTNENCCHRHIAEEAGCELCFQRCEDGFHVVMTCPHAKGVEDGNARSMGSLARSEALQ